MARGVGQTIQARHIDYLPLQPQYTCRLVQI